MRESSELSAALLRAADAAVASVDPEPAVRRWIAERGGLGGNEPLSIVALGKASPAMVRAACAAVQGPIGAVLVVSDHIEEVPPGAELIVAGHPVPNEQSIEAGLRAGEVTAAAERMLFLVSGGGSALLELPADGVTLRDLAVVTAALLESGAPIGDVNTVRTHLSQVKGGGLAVLAPAGHITLALSDVIGSPPHAIASGPTVATPTTPADAVAVIERWAIGHRVPESVTTALHRDGPGPVPRPGEYVVVGDGAVAAEAACDALRSDGYTTAVIDTALDGEAREAAGNAYARVDSGTVGVFAGETTVTVTGPGRGGRNQQAALALTSLLRPGEAAVCIGTDGIDGPTDAAGAIVDGASLAAMHDVHVVPEAALAANDAYPALDAIDALIRTGPTGTNVGDLWLIARN